MMQSPRIARWNLLFVFCLATFAQASPAQTLQPTASDEVRNLLQWQISWDTAGPGGKNPSGLHFQFFKTDEMAASGKRLVRYRVYVPGVPENKKYSLTVFKIGSDPHILSNNVYVNAKGLLMAHKPRPEQENSDFAGDDEYQLAAQGARGEPVRYSLASADRELVIPGTVVPFPLEDTGTNTGCRLEVRLALPDATAVLIYADGLPANTELPFQVVSTGEPETEKFNANDQGRAVAAAIPSTNGSKQGTLRVSLAIPECSAAVELPWGEGSYHPL